LRSLLPDWIADLRRPGVLRADLAAGLTGAVVVLPQWLAFATLAGLPPQYGLYTAIVPCIIAAWFGSSRLMVTGPANAISLTVLALLAPLATPGSAQFVQLAITLTFMVGVLQFAVGFTPVARLVDRVPHGVIVGFTAGAAVLIINSQVRT
jgi:SulP family sulfate permease